LSRAVRPRAESVALFFVLVIGIFNGIEAAMAGVLPMLVFPAEARLACNLDIVLIEDPSHHKQAQTTLLPDGCTPSVHWFIAQECSKQGLASFEGGHWDRTPRLN
jgi:hypothetical protein